MWQRIQTLWLLLGGVLMTLLLVLPLAKSSMGIQFTALGFRGQDSGYVTWGLFILAALIAFLCFFTIFLFKKRKLQMRLVIFTTLLIVGYLVYFGVLLFQYGKSILPQYADDRMTPTIWVILPVLAIVLLYRAFKGIRKDEVLVRMSKRLR